MAENTQNSRYVHHRWNTAGVTPSVPTVDDITSASFSTTDIKRGEIAINLQDERVWFRSNFGVVEIPTSSTFSSTPIDLQIVSDNGNITTNKLNFPQWQVGDVDGTNNIYMDNSEQVRVLSTNPAFSGIVYGDDYSAYFTDRSLIDKAYAISLASTVTLKNVLKAGNNSGTSSIIMGTATSILSANGGGQLDLDSYSTGGAVALTTDSGAFGEAYLYLTPTNSYLNTPGTFLFGNTTNYLQCLSGNLYLATDGLNNISGDTILMGASGTISVASSTGGKIDLDANGSITITNDNGAYDDSVLYLSPAYAEFSSYGTAAVAMVSTNDSTILVADSGGLTDAGIRLTSANKRIQLGEGMMVTDLELDSDTNIRLSTGIGNLVYINQKLDVAAGGIVISGTAVSLGSERVIRSMNSGGQIVLDAYGIAGNVLITTDEGIEATPYFRMNTSNIVLDAVTVSMTLESSNNRIQIGGPTGLLIGRCTTVEKNALPASNGMIVYDTTLNKFSFYQAGVWVEPF